MVIMASGIAHGHVRMTKTSTVIKVAQDGSNTPAKRLTETYVALVYSVLL